MENTENTEIEKTENKSVEEIATAPKATEEQNAQNVNNGEKASKAISKEERIAKVREDLAFLSEHFPKSFNSEGECHPFKIGIFNDLAERVQAIAPEMSKTRIRVALRAFTTRWRYLEAVKVNAMRIDIDGNPVEPVSQEHADFAAKELEESKKKYEEKFAEKKAKQRENYQARRAKRDVAGKQDNAEGNSEEKRQNRKPFKRKPFGDKQRQQNWNQRRNDGKHEKSLDSKPKEEFSPLNPDDIKVGLEVRVLWGSGAVPATVREVVKDKVTVELSMGMVVKVSQDQIGSR